VFFSRILTSLTIEQLDRREDVAAFMRFHRVHGVRKKFLPPQREMLNILCDVQVNGHFRRLSQSRVPQGMKQRARMFGQIQQCQLLASIRIDVVDRPVFCNLIAMGRQATFFMKSRTQVR